jgi:hypothetical protein
VVQKGSGEFGEALMAQQRVPIRIWTSAQSVVVTLVRACKGAPTRARKAARG